MTAFDRGRAAWYPPGLCSAEVVCDSNGQPRPRLATPLDTFVVHYGGAGSWLDPGDTATELASIERYARSAGKPNEYNSASDSESITWEYAGPYLAAHAGTYNATTWGHLALLGLEELTDTAAVPLIEGIRRARRQAVAAGYLTPLHRVIPHSQIRATTCPGPLFSTAKYWAAIAAPLTQEPDIMEPRYIMTHPDPMGNPSAPWFFIEGAQVRYCTGRDVENYPGYTPPPVWTPPKARAHEYDLMRKSLGL